MHFCEDLHHANVLILRREENGERGIGEEGDRLEKGKKKRKVDWVVPGRLPPSVFNCINHFHGFLTGRSGMFFCFCFSDWVKID